jgi:hypothetical protein
VVGVAPLLTGINPSAGVLTSCVLVFPPFLPPELDKLARPACISSTAVCCISPGPNADVTLSRNKPFV